MRSVHVPTTWSEVSLGAYMDYLSQMEDGLPHNEVIARTVSTFAGIPIDELDDLPLDSTLQMFREISKLLETGKDTRLRYIITIDGMKYGFDPDLGRMKFGMFADLETMTVDPDTGKNTFWENADKVMAILYRPLQKKRMWFGKPSKLRYSVEPYTGDTVEQHASRMRGLSMDTVNAAAVFFCQLGTEKQQIIRAYMTTALEKAKKKNQSSAASMRKASAGMTPS